VRFRSFSACFVVFLMSSCALAEGAATVASQGTAWLYRPASDNSNLPLTLYMDGRKLANLGKGQFFGVQVPFGLHAFSWTNASTAKAVVVPIAEEQAYFKVTFGSSQPFLVLTALQAAKALVEMGGAQPLAPSSAFVSDVIIPAQAIPKAAYNTVATDASGSGLDSQAEPARPSTAVSKPESKAVPSAPAKVVPSTLVKVVSDKQPQRSTTNPQEIESETLNRPLSYGQTTLTNDAVVKMVHAGVNEDIVANMITGQPGQFTVTPYALIELKKQDVSDKIIAAMVTKVSQPNTLPQPASANAAAVPAPNDATAGLDVGVYLKKKDEWAEVLPEVVNWKTGGVLKTFATHGIVKGDVNGHIDAGHSKNGVPTPAEFLIKTPEGVAITEYQLIRLHDEKNAREFRTVTGGVFHQSGGTSRDAIQFEEKKVANRTYAITLPDLNSGDYGFLPPGGVTSRSSSSIGKMYTFRILE
jgi:hypothetical protein